MEKTTEVSGLMQLVALLHTAASSVWNTNLSEEGTLSNESKVGVRF